ncbi:MAG TPA: M1 family aminopeptidase [Burkholderiaceae bacterium]|nr:M1 family aminopeptidase [Burkholderiaceae bacterium]
MSGAARAGGMLGHVAAFEFRYQLRNPALLVGCAIFFLLTFGSVTIDEIQIGARGNVHVDSPYAILETLMTMAVMSTFVVVAVVAQAVLRDDETGFAPILQATRLRAPSYLVGRWLGASAACLLLLATVPLAIALGSRMPWLDPERVGPFHPLDYVVALVAYGMPTLLLLTAFCLALATATRSLAWTYVGAVALLVAYAVARSALRDARFDDIAALLDPFARSAIGKATKYWTATERNASLPPLTGLLLANRVLWLTMAVAVFALAAARFRFAERAGKAAPPFAARAASAVAPSRPRPLAQRPAPGRGAALASALALARIEFSTIVRGPAFLALNGIGALSAAASLWFAGQVYGGDVHPVTRLMVDSLTGSFTLFPIIMAIYYGGELAWRDRERRIHEIVDATAAPDWTHLAPKLLAVTLVLAAAYASASLGGIAVQLLKGGARLELERYLLWFVVPGTVTAAQLAVLSLFVQVLVPGKFVGWAVMLVYLVASVSLNAAGFEHNLYNYAGVPSVPLSDMNGMGRFWIGRAWFQAYWTAAAAALALWALALWRRGATIALRPRLRRLPARLAGPVGVALGVVGAGWAGLGAWIYVNTNIENRYEPAPLADRRLADYERTLLPYAAIPQPRIVAVTLDVDLHPRETRVGVRGSYTIENRTAAPIDTLHLRWLQPLELDAVDLPGAVLERDYGSMNYRIYRLPTPLAPGERRTLGFRTHIERRGFENDRPYTRIVENGTFLDNFDLAPLIGMSRERLLVDRNKRRKYGLPAELRPAKLEDDGARAFNALRHDSDWVVAQISVTTDADQTPIAPGTVVSDETADGRRTVRFRTDTPIIHFFSIQSARYAVARSHWRDVDLAVYYDPRHGYNVQRMLDAMKLSLQLFSREFSPYQFKQARIVEFPGYEAFAQSFANTVPYSESIGFIFLEDDDPERIDMVTYVTAHEIAHQWWGHQLVPADQQGATMLVESLAQYSALLAMEQVAGREQVRKFLKYELDRYLRERGGEAVEELPLARVEDQPYIHYRKATLAMTWLRESLGVDVVDATLRDLLARFAFKAAPYPNARDFLWLLREHAGPGHEELVADLLERITLYDARARDAHARRRPDGRYDVAFTIDARKFYADGVGHETEAPLAEAFDVGVFSAEPGRRDFDASSILMLQRRQLASGSQVVRVTVDARPRFAGVDPFNRRIDRNSEDNLAPVHVDDD